MLGITQRDSEADDEAVVYQRKNSQRMVINDSEDETELPVIAIAPSSKKNDVANSSCERKEKSDVENLMLDSEPLATDTECQQSSSEATESIGRLRIPFNADLFDAEEESDREEKHLTESGDSGDADEDSAEIKISAKLKQRLSKGASKKAKSNKLIRHSRSDELNQIHKESQRLVRESSVRLPYYKPPKVDLSVFLSRTEQKQLRLASISPALHSKPSWKSIATASILSPCLNNLSQMSLLPVSDDVSDCLQNGISNSKTLTATSVENSSADCVGDKRQMHCLSLETVPMDSVLDEDDLPDLVIEVQMSAGVDHQCESEKAFAVSASESVSCELSLQTKNDPAQRTFSKNLTANIQGCESSKVSSNDSLLKDLDLRESRTSLYEAESSLELTTDDKKTCKENKYSFLADGTKALLDLPKLSSTDAYIDLDEEVNREVTVTPRINAGVSSLMERLIKHSQSVPAKKSRNVEITIENGRESWSIAKTMENKLHAKESKWLKRMLKNQLQGTQHKQRSRKKDNYKSMT